MAQLLHVALQERVVQVEQIEDDGVEIDSVSGRVGEQIRERHLSVFPLVVVVVDQGLRQLIVAVQMCRGSSVLQRSSTL